MEFSENLRMLRDKSGMSQAELAEKLGVTRALIAQYETGAKSPNVILANRIAKLLGVTLNDMVRKGKENA